METTFAATWLGSKLPPDVRHLIFEHVYKHQMSLVFKELKEKHREEPAVMYWHKVKLNNAGLEPPWDYEVIGRPISVVLF